MENSSYSQNDNLSDIVESYQIESLPTVFMTMLKNDQVVVLDKIIGYNWTRFVQSYIKNIQLLTDYLEIKNGRDDLILSADVFEHVENTYDLLTSTLPFLLLDIVTVSPGFIIGLR